MCVPRIQNWLFRSLEAVAAVTCSCELRVCLQFEFLLRFVQRVRELTRSGEGVLGCCGKENLERKCGLLRNRFRGL